MRQGIADKVRTLGFGAAVAGFFICVAGAAATESAAALRDGEVLIEIPAQPDSGFRYPYFVFVPQIVSPGGTARLLVVPNNTGKADDDFEVHRKKAAGLASAGKMAMLGRELGTPVLVPVFPRPAATWRTYTHALDRDALLVKEAEYARLDLQLVAIISHARAVLVERGVSVKEKVFLFGFSASGNFTNRFAALHPQLVRAVVSGGVNGLPILPVGELGRLLPLQPLEDGRLLPYPIGVGDLAEVAGAPFDSTGYRRVSQFVFMGALDKNDTYPYDDAWDDDERRIIREAISETMMPDRWRRSQQVLAALGYPIQCVTYGGTGHMIRSEMLEDIKEFLRVNDGPDHRTITPHEYGAVLDEIESAHVNGLYWSGDERIPAHWREKWQEGTLFVRLEEWIEGQDYQQLDAFLQKAGDDLVLRAPGRGDVSLKGQRWGTVSTGNGQFQAVVFQVGKERLEGMPVGVQYTLHAVGNSESWWSAREGVALVRQGPK